ncbi:MAG: hypothetical protein AAF503_10950, partial [Pseudomonadota bacterium]
KFKAGPGIGAIHTDLERTMTPTDVSPADAETHTPDHCDHRAEGLGYPESCAARWVEKRRAHKASPMTGLPQPVRW